MLLKLMYILKIYLRLFKVTQATRALRSSYFRTTLISSDALEFQIRN